MTTDQKIRSRATRWGNGSASDQVVKAAKGSRPSNCQTDAVVTTEPGEPAPSIIEGRP
jgi:hypothetical protein